MGAAMVDALLDQAVVDVVHVLDIIEAADDRNNVTHHQCDVTDVHSLRAAAVAIGARPVVLVNNAGGDPGSGITAADHGPFEDPDRFRAMVDLNFVSAHVVTSVFGPDLEAGAAICSTASVAGLMPSALYAYGAAKAALIHWTRSMARVLGPRGVRINAVAPGIIRTYLWEQLQPDLDLYRSTVAAITPLLTDQTPSEIADAVAFLCSDRASAITGQTLAVDGGMTTGAPIEPPEPR